MVVYPTHVSIVRLDQKSLHNWDESFASSLQALNLKILVPS